MTDRLTSSQRAAYDRGTARALADVGDVQEPTTMSVSLDRGGGLDGRTYIEWCLLHQGPTSRCACGWKPGESAATLIEDPIDALAGVAGIIASSRKQLELHSAAAAGIVDVVTTRDVL